MTLLILIGLSLALAGVAGLQFFYLIYLERINSEQKKRIYELERHSRYVAKRLTESQKQIDEQNEILENVFEDSGEIIWADVIEDR